MTPEQANEALALLRRVVGQARDDTALQNWGVIWMVHAFTNGGAFAATNVLMDRGVRSPWPFVALWSGVLAFNIPAIFVLKARTAGARTFIETQIWAIWLSFIGAVALTAIVNHVSGFAPFVMGPVIAVLSAFAFAMMGSVMGRAWYGAAAVFGAGALAMAALPEKQFYLLGALWGAGQFTGGMLLDRARRRRRAGVPHLV
jgi:hypothetical protein